MSKTPIILNDISDLSKLVQPTIPDGMLASEVRTLHLEHAKANGYPEFKIVGRTFTLRKFIWVHGGRWDKESKTQFVPAHVWIKVQKAVNDITNLIDENIKTREQAKAIEKAQAPKRTRKVKATA